MSNAKAVIRRTPPRYRSAVSNRSRLFASPVDGRGAWARRYRDLVEDIGRDLGGVETLSSS